MAVAQAFRVERKTLAAGVLTAIYPKVRSFAAAVGNATASDVNMYTNDDEAEYLVIAAGYERTISLKTHRFDPANIAFWLKSTPGGTVVILWL